MDVVVVLDSHGIKPREGDMSSKLVIGVRHLADHNRLRTNLFDGPLVSGQEPKAREISSQIIAVARKRRTSKISIIHSPQRRSVETANMIGAALRNKGADVTIVLEQGLCEI